MIINLHTWVCSVSTDLKFDAERDLQDIGAKSIPVHQLNKLKYAKINGPENGFIRKGVIFSTYSSLIGESRQTASSYDEENMPVKQGYQNRLRQLIQWCGQDFDGVIVFDGLFQS
jgi:hypothetical protein